MTDQDLILALNQSFYRAFAMRDLPAMEALWAERLPLSCIHPGWPPLFGREEVMSSWREILRQPNEPAIRARNEHLTMRGEVSLVVCEEVLNGRPALAASNLFAREDGRWRLVHRQSGPMADRREPRIEPGPKARLH